MSDEKKNQKSKNGLSINLDFKDVFHILRRTVQEKSLFTAIDSKLDEKIEAAVERGEITKADGERIAAEMKAGMRGSVDKVYEKIDNGIERTMKTLRLATVEDVNKIEERLDRVLEKLDKLEKPKRSSSPRKSSSGGSSRRSGTAGKTTSSRKSGKSETKKE